MRKVWIVLGLCLTFFTQAFSVCAAAYEYDDLDRVTRVTYEDGTSVTYFYDANGNLVETRVAGTNQKDNLQTGEVPATELTTKEAPEKSEQTDSRGDYAAELNDNAEQNESGQTGSAGVGQNDTLQNSDARSEELNDIAEGEKAQKKNDSGNQESKSLFAAGGAVAAVLATAIVVILGAKRRKQGNEE